MSIELEKESNKKREKIASKVDRLEDFCRNNLVLWISGYDFLNCVEDEDERKNLEDKLKQALTDYKYIIDRQSRGKKLNDDDLEILREAGVGRKFGYKKEIEDIASRYSYDNVKDFKKFLYCACAEYGSLDNFRQHYIQELCNGGHNKYNVGNVLNKYVNNIEDLDKYFITNFDISSPNFQSEGNKGYELIWKKMGLGGVVFDKEEIEKAMNEKLTSIQRQVLKLRFGLEDKQVHTKTKIASIRGCSKANIWQKEQSAFARLKNEFMYGKYITLDEEKTREFIEKYFEYHDIFSDAKLVELDKDVKKELQKIMGVNLEKKELEEKIKKFELKDLELSVRSYNALSKNTEIKTVADIIALEKREFKGIRSLGKKSVDEIIDKIHSLGLKMKWEKDDDLEKKSNSGPSIEKQGKIVVTIANSIGRLDLPVGPRNALARVGIHTLDELTRLEERELMQIKRIGKSAMDEIIDKIHSLGLKMKWERDAEEKTDIDTELEGSIQQLKTAYSDLKDKEEECEKLKEQLKDSRENQKNNEAKPNKVKQESGRKEDDGPSFEEL